MPNEYNNMPFEIINTINGAAENLQTSPIISLLIDNSLVLALIIALLLFIILYFVYSDASSAAQVSVWMFIITAMLIFLHNRRVYDKVNKKSKTSEINNAFNSDISDEEYVKVTLDDSAIPVKTSTITAK